MLLFSLLLLIAAPLSALETSLREELRNRIESIPDDQPLVAGSMRVPASTEVRAFYRNRLYAPGWVESGGSAPLADELLQAIAEADRDAMNPADYHPEAVRERLEQVATDQPTGPGALVDLELLLTGIWFQLGSDSLIGQLNPQAVDPDWMIQRPTADLRRRLEWALEEGRVYESLRWLLPSVEGYVGLRKALAEHRALRGQGGFVHVPPGPALRPGIRDERVPLLRQRLRQTDDLDVSPVDDPAYFDDGLESAVRHFQARHGLADDGVVGPLTLAELNTPLEARIRQLMVNMERWRWLPHDPGERFIMVNIAGFEMVVVEHGVPVMRQRVIVGRDYRQTPVFTGNMTYLVLNPSWEVPNSIAVRDILPEVRRNPDYLRRMGFRVLQGWGSEEREVDPETVDWQHVSARQFPYRFRQMPGPLNALGQVKFMFPNRYAVYLHDTPARDLFHRPDRAFSSGCIRVEHPLELIDLLLEGSTRWTPDAVRQVLAGGQERTVSLPRSMPVHLVYMTAWVDNRGELQLRRDIYNRDQRVMEALLQLNSRS
ncbi:MAG: L,D-transpeptidase family protein [Ectothiorhodospiraceae bacterium]|nr:L,D-transpeptidase family protein [Ectothiorhodospiraceae bacterium]